MYALEWIDYETGYWDGTSYYHEEDENNVNHLVIFSSEEEAAACAERLAQEEYDQEIAKRENYVAEAEKRAAVHAEVVKFLAEAHPGTEPSDLMWDPYRRGQIKAPEKKIRYKVVEVIVK